jgi:catechol 2,3-dioxygenase-like lactoylglutathione lyase family enzyme
MTRTVIETIAPCFIVANVSQTLAFYRDVLGFSAMYREPEDDPFFAIVQRDGVMIFLKHVDGGEAVSPNPVRSPGMKWDAYVYTPDPDELAAEFEGKGAEFNDPLGLTSEGLKGFEIADPDGYVLFFGKPI